MERSVMTPVFIDADVKALKFPELVNVSEKRTDQAIQVLLSKKVVIQVVEV